MFKKYLKKKDKIELEKYAIQQNRDKSYNYKIQRFKSCQIQNAKEMKGQSKSSNKAHRGWIRVVVNNSNR